MVRKWHAEACVMTTADSVFEHPTSLDEAMKSQDCSQWKAATDAEYMSLLSNGTWTYNHGKMQCKS